MSLLPEEKQDLELTEDERVVMGILRERGSTEHKQLYTLCCQSTPAPKQESTFRNYLQRLAAKSHIRFEFRDNLRVYDVVAHG